MTLLNVLNKYSTFKFRDARQKNCQRVVSSELLPSPLCLSSSFVFFAPDFIEYKSWEFVLHLYKTLVKLCLERYRNSGHHTIRINAIALKNAEEIHQDVALIKL